MPHVVEDDPLPIAAMIPQVDPIYSSGYFQGDMMMTEQQIAEDFGVLTAEQASDDGETVELNITEEQRLLGAAAAGRRKWPNNVIFYQFEAGYPSSQATTVRNALVDYAALTNVQAVESTGSGNYALIRLGSGCSSFVGMIGGAQTMNLASGCMRRGTILHEFMHALGFSHEHTAPDRDSFVTVNLANVISGREHNFNRITGSLAVSNSYDHSSVMHYSERAFSSNGQKTIDCRGNACGQRSGFSSKDVADINALYPALSSSPTRNPTSRSPTRNPTSRSPTRNPTSRSPTRNPTSRSPTRNPTTRSPSSEPSAEPTFQPTGVWTCSASRYDNDDGCDCACGTVDPDCAKPRVADNAKLFCGSSPADESRFFCNASNACSAIVESPPDSPLDGNIILIAAGSFVAVSAAAVFALVVVGRRRRGGKRRPVDVEKSDMHAVNPMATYNQMGSGTAPYAVRATYPVLSSPPRRPQRPEQMYGNRPGI